VKPSVGRIVHYNSGSTCWAAIVTQIIDADEGRVHLTIFPPNINPFPQRAVELGTEGSTWHWPERVD
jgi:hypothetical protein